MNKIFIDILYPTVVVRVMMWETGMIHGRGRENRAESVEGKFSYLTMTRLCHVCYQLSSANLTHTETTFDTHTIFFFSLFLFHPEARLNS